MATNVFLLNAGTITLSDGHQLHDLERIAPVAQLDRALPSEGRGHRFESCRVRHYINNLGDAALQAD
jgi:hypothetical protein